MFFIRVQDKYVTKFIYQLKKRPQFFSFSFNFLSRHKDVASSHKFSIQTLVSSAQMEFQEFLNRTPFLGKKLLLCHDFWSTVQQIHCAIYVV